MNIRLQEIRIVECSNAQKGDFVISARKVAPQGYMTVGTPLDVLAATAF